MNPKKVNFILRDSKSDSHSTLFWISIYFGLTFCFLLTNFNYQSSLLRFKKKLSHTVLLQIVAASFYEESKVDWSKESKVDLQELLMEFMIVWFNTLISYTILVLLIITFCNCDSNCPIRWSILCKSKAVFWFSSTSTRKRKTDDFNFLYFSLTLFRIWKTSLKSVQKKSGSNSRANFLHQFII